MKIVTIKYLQLENKFEIPKNLLEKIFNIINQKFSKKSN